MRDYSVQRGLPWAGWKMVLPVLIATTGASARAGVKSMESCPFSRTATHKPGALLYNQREEALLPHEFARVEFL